MKENFGGLFKADTEQQITAFVKYLKFFLFLEKAVRKAEIEVRVKKLKNRKPESNTEVRGEMIMSGFESMRDWVQKLRNRNFKSGR